jgi:ketosteroid isomerase-like protein
MKGPRLAVAGLWICTGLLLASCAAQPLANLEEPERDHPAQVIVDLEHRFAATSRERGARTAFLEFLAEDSIVLQPGPVWGRAAWESADELAGTLDWAPDRAEVSADGGLGFATGPWLLTPAAEGAARVEGRYLTIWRKSAGGWAVVFDGGFGRRAGEDAGSPDPQAQLGAVLCEPSKDTSAGELQLRDLGLSGSPERSFAARVLAQLGPAAVLFHPPAVEGIGDRAAQQASLDALPGSTQLSPMGGAIAASGDLAYTYGISSPAADAKANASYAHIWCHAAGSWTLLLEIRTRLPG